MTISQIVDTEAIYRVAVQQLQADQRDIWSPQVRAQRVHDWNWRYKADETPLARPSAAQPPTARS